MPINGNSGIAVWILTNINMRHNVAFNLVIPWPFQRAKRMKTVRSSDFQLSFAVWATKSYSCFTHAKRLNYIITTTSTYDFSLTLRNLSNFVQLNLKAYMNSRHIITLRERVETAVSQTKKYMAGFAVLSRNPLLNDSS